MLFQANKATTNSTKSATVPMSLHEQAKSAGFWQERSARAWQLHRKSSPSSLPVEQRDRYSVGLHPLFQNAIKNPGPCLKGLSERNCSEEIMTLTEPRGEVSDQAEAQRE